VTGEVIVTSSYEANDLKLRGHACRMVPRANDKGLNYIFRGGKKLEADRQAFLEDVDMQTWIDAHRNLKWEGRQTLRAARNNADYRNQAAARP